MNIPIIYEDEWLLVLDKPFGLLVIPSPKKEQRTLTSILNDDAQDKGKTYRLHPCHRLDRETSGLIIYAKGKSIQQKMMDEFKERKVKKNYVAFVQGALDKREGEINTRIEGQEALTRYKVVEVRKEFSVVEVQPVTGRTNQIRLHFCSISHPIVGETKFAFRRYFTLRHKRLCLHAQYIAFTHPVTQKPIKLVAELAPDMKTFLEKHSEKK